MSWPAVSCPPPLAVYTTMAFTMQQWQWILQQQQSQVQPPQPMQHWRQGTVAPAAKDWWTENSGQVRTATPLTDIASSTHPAGHSQAQQHNHSRNALPWFKKKVEAGQQNPTAPPPPVAIAPQEQGSAAAPEPTNALSYLPLAIQRLATAPNHTGSEGARHINYNS